MKRNPTFDVVKFLLMLLVVDGHFQGYSIVKRELGLSFLNNINIGVAMPAFFMFSGYFAANKLSGGGGNCARDWFSLAPREFRVGVWGRSLFVWQDYNRRSGAVSIRESIAW